MRGKQRQQTVGWCWAFFRSFSIIVYTSQARQMNVLLPSVEGWLQTYATHCVLRPLQKRPVLYKFHPQKAYPYNRRQPIHSWPPINYPDDAGTRSKLLFDPLRSPSWRQSHAVGLRYQQQYDVWFLTPFYRHHIRYFRHCPYSWRSANQQCKTLSFRCDQGSRGPRQPHFFNACSSRLDSSSDALSFQRQK